MMVTLRVFAYFLRRCARWSPCAALAWLSACHIAAAQPVKPHAYLQSAAAPNFYERHTLPRLTRWGWNLSYDATVEIAERWGYALELAGYLTPAVVNDINNNPLGHNGRLVALSESDPDRYPLSVLAYRPLVHNAATMPTHLLADYYVRTGSGSQVVDPLTGAPSWRTVSPQAPDAVFQWAAEQEAAPIAALRERTPISMILSGGEYGVSVYGHSGSFWQQDPAVVAAKGTDSWFDYASQQKGRSERIVSDAVRQAAPDRDLFLFYTSDGAGDRGAYANWWQWRFDYENMQGVSDLANSSLYYKHANTGWTGSRDMLTLMLNAKSQQQALGDKLSYNWLNAGFKTEFSDMNRYMGFLKACYTAGMTGGVAGYFSMPAGGFDADITGAPPNWLSQMETLAHAHGAFSYLEKYLRDGELVAGPNNHAWSTDLPAYELPTGDATARVLARKLNDRQEWLVTAWAADGADRTVTTQLAGLGSIQLLARSAGTMYLVSPSATGTVQRLLDPDGMSPSSALNIVRATTDAGGLLTLLGDNVVLDGESFTIDFTAAADYRLVGVEIDGQLLSDWTSSYAFNNLTANHTIHFQVLPIASHLAADFDQNGVVAGADASRWRTGFGASGNALQAQGDADGNGRVDGADFLVWQRQLGGMPSMAASAAVPEPGPATLLAVSLAARLLSRRPLRNVKR